MTLNFFLKAYVSGKTEDHRGSDGTLQWNWSADGAQFNLHVMRYSNADFAFIQYLQIEINKWASACKVMVSADCIQDELTWTYMNVHLILVCMYTQCTNKRISKNKWTTYSWPMLQAHFSTVGCTVQLTLIRSLDTIRVWGARAKLGQKIGERERTFIFHTFE